MLPTLGMLDGGWPAGHRPYRAAAPVPWKAAVPGTSPARRLPVTDLAGRLRYAARASGYPCPRPR